MVAFQPHRFTRTAFLARDFADALRGADRVYLAPVYAASEPAIPGVSERSIGEPLAAAGADVRYVERVDDLEDKLMNELPQGAMLLMLGAGDITDVAARLAGRLGRNCRRGIGARVSVTTAAALQSLLEPRDVESLRADFGEQVRFGEPLAPYTSWKIGGPADALVTISDEAQLAKLLRFCLRRRHGVVDYRRRKQRAGGRRRRARNRRAFDRRLRGGSRPCRRRCGLGGSGRIGRDGAGNGQGGIGRRRRESARWPGSPEPSAARCA